MKKKYLSYEEYDPYDEKNVDEYDELRNKLRLMNLSAIARELSIHREVLSRFCRGETKKMSGYSKLRIEKLLKDTFYKGYPDGIIDINEVSELTGYTIEYLYSEKDSIGIPYHEICGKLLFSKTEFMSWVNNKDQSDETIG